MRSFRDNEGKRWEATEVGAHGVGARGPGGYFPQPTIATVVFSREDGCKITREVGVDWLDKASVPDLIAVLEESQEDDDG